MRSDRQKRLRLLIVTRDRFPPFRVDLIELFSRWLTPRFDIDWVMRREAGAAASVIEGRSGERFFVGAGGIACWLTVQLRQGVRVARGGVDLAQVRDAAFSGLFFLLAAKIGGRPFVYWMSYPIAEGYRHRARYQTTWRYPLLRLGRFVYGALASAALDRLVLPGAAHVFVQSERMKADVAARGIKPRKITAVPMGVSLAAYRYIAPVDDPRLTGRRSLVYVGALDPEREIERLVWALARVVDGDFNAVLVVVGDAGGSDRQRLDAAARAACVEDRVIFTGFLPLAEALAWVRRADVCLAPFPVWPTTYLSATPTKLVEYLAMGRPVVASDHPDQRSVIEGSGAGVIAPATADGFAAAIMRLLKDPAAAEAMGARGPVWVAAHRDYAAISRMVAEVYASMIGCAVE